MPLKGEAKRQYNSNYHQKNKESISKRHKERYQEQKEWLKIRRLLPVGLII